MRKKSLQIFFQYIPLLFCAVISLLLITYRYFDYDEFQHIHIAWYIKKGFVLYRDFYEHHGPLYPTLASWVWTLFRFPDSILTVFIFRFFNLIFFFISLRFIFLTAKNLFTPNVAALSITFLVTNPTIINKIIEVRPDPLLMLFSSLITFFYFKSKRSWIHLVAHTILAITVHYKILVSLIPLKIIHFLHMGFPVRILRYLVVFALGLTAILSTLSLMGNMDPFQFLDVILFMIKKVPSFPPIRIFSLFGPSVIINITYIIFFLYGSYLLLRDDLRNRRIFAQWALVTSGLILLSSQYTQWYLMFLPPSAIIASYGYLKLSLLYKKRSNLLCSILVLTLITSASFLLTEDLNKKRNIDQITFTEIFGSVVPKDAAIYMIWNNYGGYMFHHHLHYYWYTSFENLVDGSLTTSIINQRINDSSNDNIYFLAGPHELTFKPLHNYLRACFTQSIYDPKIWKYHKGCDWK